MACLKPKTILSEIKKYLESKLSTEYKLFDTTPVTDLELTIDDEYKQYRLALFAGVGDLDGRFCLFWITIGLHDIRVSSIVWTDRNRKFALGDPGCLEQLVQHIVFCITSCEPSWAGGCGFGRIEQSDHPQ